MIEEPTEFAILWTKQYPQLMTLSWLRLQEQTDKFLSIDSFYHENYKFPVWRQVPIYCVPDKNGLKLTIVYYTNYNKSDNLLE